MAIFLITGTPGAGKTLNTIKSICEMEEFVGRPVYSFNIKGLQTGWNELELEEAIAWNTLPKNSVIVFDEAYDIFPMRQGKVDPPEHVKALATHRHGGYDIFIICQKVVGQLDAFVRGLVNYHWHFERQFGSSITRKMEWQRCVDDVNDFRARRDAQAKPVKFDKKYFGAYKSAEAHTHKTRFPKKYLYMVIFALVLLGVAVTSAIQLFNSAGEDSVNPSPTDFNQLSAGSFLPTSSLSGDVPALTFEEYQEEHTPRIRYLDYTAPVYDDVAVPLSAPIISCSSIQTETKTSCNCATEQFTKVSVPENLCLHFAANGIYQYHKPIIEDDFDPFAFQQSSTSVTPSNPLTNF